MLTALEALVLMQQAAQWFFTEHARLRMDQRDISQRDVKHAVACAAAVVPSDTTPGAWVITGPDCSGETIHPVIKVDVLFDGRNRNVVLTVIGG